MYVHNLPLPCNHQRYWACTYKTRLQYIERLYPHYIPLTLLPRCRKLRALMLVHNHLWQATLSNYYAHEMVGWWYSLHEELRRFENYKLHKAWRKLQERHVNKTGRAWEFAGICRMGRNISVHIHNYVVLSLRIAIEQGSICMYCRETLHNNMFAMTNISTSEDVGLAS